MSTPVSATNHSIPLSQFQNKRKLTWKAECVCVSEEGFLGRGAELRPQGESPDSQGQESLKYELPATGEQKTRKNSLDTRRQTIQGVKTVLKASDCTPAFHLIPTPPAQPPNPTDDKFPTSDCIYNLLWLLKMSTLVLGFGLVLFMFKSMYFHEEFSLQPVLPHPDPVLPRSNPAAQMPKLLPEERLRSLFSYDGIWLFPKNQCHCETKGQGYNFEGAYGQKDLPAVKARRQAEFEHFQRREGLPRPPPLLAPPNLPFGYPVHGVEVMPLHTVPIPGLQFDGPSAPIYKARAPPSQSLCALGILSLAHCPAPSPQWWLVSDFDRAPIQMKHQTRV
ncbi:Beta-1,4 N-acetylgalactosaminyltransferase 2 [Myotis brandtii]|uniref:Beta-1,4 N-acetylgalactosaminyltransferase 2 n=1 Tax=Myotis brandtii TaxID=109478 RepID=S7MZE7_MYOBR|nr:Beta-1,4 N-acetylgalactosaminyltransferase 2 [Myotis brandtii]